MHGLMFNCSQRRVKKGASSSLRVITLSLYPLRGVNKRLSPSQCGDAKHGGRETVLTSSCCSSLPGRGSQAAHRDGFVRKTRRIGCAPLSGVIEKKKKSFFFLFPILFLFLRRKFFHHVFKRCATGSRMLQKTGRGKCAPHGGGVQVNFCAEGFSCFFSSFCPAAGLNCIFRVICGVRTDY